MALKLKLALITLPVLIAFPQPASARPRPPVATTADAIPAPGHIVTVDRKHFYLRLWKHTDDRGRYKLIRRWKVAVGKPGFKTPGGAYHIQAIAINPTWTAPDSSWVPANQRGKNFPANSPKNPIAAAFISFDAINGLGFHGTTNTASLGHRASHGCIRMSIPAVKSLARQVEVGDPVVIF
jgi:lipoprotein-anchoring transpeptidase ErfK/SrfK